jgi:hypothetical protein
LLDVVSHSIVEGPGNSTNVIISAGDGTFYSKKVEDRSVCVRVRADGKYFGNLSRMWGRRPA